MVSIIVSARCATRPSISSTSRVAWVSTGSPEVRISREGTAEGYRRSEPAWIDLDAHGRLGPRCDGERVAQLAVRGRDAEQPVSVSGDLDASRGERRTERRCALPAQRADRHVRGERERGGDLGLLSNEGRRVAPDRGPDREVVRLARLDKHVAGCGRPARADEPTREPDRAQRVERGVRARGAEVVVEVGEADEL